MFVPGHLQKKHKQFRFGESTWVSHIGMVKALDQLFRDRPVILIGHGLNNDIQILARWLKYDVYGKRQLSRTIDTSRLAVFAQIPEGLLKMWKHLNGIHTGGSHGWHNAGNDAVYTLQSLLLLAVTAQKDWKLPPSTPVAKDPEWRKIISRARLSVLAVGAVVMAASLMYDSHAEEDME